MRERKWKYGFNNEAPWKISDDYGTWREDDMSKDDMSRIREIYKSLEDWGFVADGSTEEAVEKPLEENATIGDLENYLRENEVEV